VRIDKKKGMEMAEGDMTPMIDMTFQLIAFFMVLINFSEAEQDERVKLPESVLAKPPESPMEDYVTVQMTETGECIVDGQAYALTEIQSILSRQADFMERLGTSRGDVTIIVRAHGEVATGKVQNLIEECQKARYEKFVLRAKEKQEY
jgi:biopolymer transport protein ExbD